MSGIAAVSLLVDVRYESDEAARDRSHITTVLRLLQASDLWFGFAYHGRHSARRLRGPASLEEIGAAAATWGMGDFVLRPEPGKREGSPALLISINPVGFHLSLLVEGQALESRRERLIGMSIDAVARVHRELPAFIGASTALSVGHFVYPRPRPPRPHRLWGSDHIVDFASVRFHAWSSSGDPEALKRMITAEMPAGARREERGGDLFAFVWAEDLTSKAHIARAFSARDRWIGRVTGQGIAADYNAYGDQLVPLLQTPEHPLLTFYFPGSHVGYKAIVATAEGEVDEEEWSEIASWISAGRLPDGSPLDRLYLIVPIREAALAIHDRAAAIGIEAVLYPSGDGALWNPFPPGLWLEDGYSPPTQ